MQKYECRYDDLANAIILQAVNDYRRALNGKGTDKGNGYRPPEYVIKDVEKFFRSSYFRLLTKVNGEYLLDHLKKEHEEKVRKKECTLN